MQRLRRHVLVGAGWQNIPIPNLHYNLPEGPRALQMDQLQAAQELL